MPKQTIQYDSPIDAFVAVAKRLSRYETEADIESEEFFASYLRGEAGDDARVVEWANDYRHFLALRAELFSDNSQRILRKKDDTSRPLDQAVAE